MSKVNALVAMTFPEKVLQLISAAQYLGIDFRVDNTEQVVFSHEKNNEVFNTVYAAKEPWCLNASWEPWFFSIVREDKETAALLNSARIKMRTAANSLLNEAEARVFRDWLKGDHGITL